MNEILLFAVLFTSADVCIKFEMKALESDKFVERQAASETLEKMGWATRDYIKAGEKSDNPEVAHRCRQLLVLYYGAERVIRIIITPNMEYFAILSKIEKDGFFVTHSYYLGNHIYEFHLRRR